MSSYNTVPDAGQLEHLSDSPPARAASAERTNDDPFAHFLPLNPPLPIHTTESDTMKCSNNSFWIPFGRVEGHSLKITQGIRGLGKNHHVVARRLITFRTCENSTTGTVPQTSRFVYWTFSKHNQLALRPCGWQHGGPSSHVEFSIEKLSTATASIPTDLAFPA